MPFRLLVPQLAGGLRMTWRRIREHTVEGLVSLGPKVKLNLHPRIEDAPEKPAWLTKKRLDVRLASTSFGWKPNWTPLGQPCRGYGTPASHREQLFGPTIIEQAAQSMPGL
jgi:hypothetical protein